MNNNEQLLHTFYTAFQNKDWNTMQSYYHEKIVFNDAVFKNLEGKKVGAMWHMLLQNGKDLELIFDGIEANDQAGKAHWVVTYTFFKTGNKVINDISASFQFKDGKIIKHNDTFDFQKWAKQAFGVVGILFGRFPFFHKKISETALKSLNTFIQKNKEIYQ